MTVTPAGPRVLPVRLVRLMTLVTFACVVSLACGCSRKDAPREPLGPPADLSTSNAASLSASQQPPDGAIDLIGKSTCRDGSLFDLGGAPMVVGGFGTLTPIDDTLMVPRVALTGTMGAVTEGALPTDELERVTCKMVGNLRSCFQFELKTKPKLRGALALEVDIALNGKVMQTRRTGGFVPSDLLMGCISNAFVYAQYPMPKAKTTFTYSLQVRTHAHLSPRSVQIVDSGVSFGGAGALPPEIVKRIVRATFPRFRACYELGVDIDPALKGQVTARFVVTASGAIEGLKPGPTTIPDKIVASCVMGVFQTMSFPEPAGGAVEVAMPLVFANVP